MLISMLIRQAFQAKKSFINAMKNFNDAAITEELESSVEEINASLTRIENDQNKADFEILLETEVRRIYKFIKVKISFIETKGINYLEKIQAIELLGNITNKFFDLYECFSPVLTFQPVAKWQSKRLHLEQQLACKEPTINQALNELLTKIKEKAFSADFSLPNECIINYPKREKIEDEYWISYFLNNLQTHLSQAGINAVLVEESLENESFYQHINSQLPAKYLIIVGTESLFQGSSSNTNTISNELILITQSRAKEQNKTLSILLNGEFDNLLPAYVFMYTDVVDWREYSYLSNLKSLLANIYEMALDSSYQQLWVEFEQRYPILVAGFQKEIVDHIETKELDNQQATELLSNIQNTSLNLPSTLNWATLIECVKVKYISESIMNNDFAEIEDLTNSYINLAIIEKQEDELIESITYEEWIKHQKKSYDLSAPLLLQEILKGKNNKELKKQLILGQAGTGKSVFCHYLAQQWAKNKWGADESFTLLIWIPLRFLADEKIFPKDKESISLGKVFYEQYKDQLQIYLSVVKKKQWIRMLDKLIAEHSSQILYILDGFDEVASICQLNKREATYQTQIIGKLLAQERIIITSRSDDIDYYLSSRGIVMERCLKNIGFTDKSIENYIQNYPWQNPKKGKTLQIFFNKAPFIREIAYIPANLANICHYWQTVNIGHSFVSLTDLHSELSENLFFKYLEKNLIKNNNNLIIGNNIEIFTNKIIKPIILFLEELAFLQMQDCLFAIKTELIFLLLDQFTQNKYDNEFLTFNEILATGFLISPERKEYFSEEKRKYHFVHLTFQEFLAARYLAQIFKQEEKYGEVAFLKKTEQSEKLIKRSLTTFVQKYKYDPRYERIWWFVAGLLKKHKGGIERFFNSLLSVPRELSGSYDVLLWIKCLEESRLTDNLNEAVKRDLIKNIKEITQATLNKRVYISDGQYAKNFFEYLYSSPMIYERLDLLQTEETVRETLDILNKHSNLPTSVLEKMVSLLRDKKEHVRHLIVGALSKQSNLSDSILHMMVRLLRLLSDENEKVRRLALSVLGQQPNLSDRVLNAIVRLLSNENKKVRHSALIALSHQSNLRVSILNEMVKLLSDEHCTVRSLALSVLSQQPNLSVSILNEMVRLLSDENCDVRSSALSALGHQPNLSDKALHEMVGLLNDEDWTVRRSAQSALGHQPNLLNRVLHEMVRLLSDEHCTTRRSVLDALGHQPNLQVSILDEMVRLLSDEHCIVKRSALDALSKQPNLSDWALHEMARLLSDERCTIRRSALNALSKQSNLRVGILNEMVRLLRDKEWGVRRSALNALSQQSNLQVGILNEMVRLLSDEHGDVRRSALDTLGQQPNLQVSVLLKMIKLLSDENWAVRRSALDALGHQPNLLDWVLHKIARSLSDESCDVRSAAQFALGQQLNLSDNVLHEIVRLLSDKNWNVRSAALSVLVQRQNLSDNVLHGIVRLLSDENWNVRSAALSVLGKQSNLSDSVLHKMVRLLSDENGYTRGSAQSALCQRSNLRVSVLNEMVGLLNDKNGYVKNSVLEVLSHQMNLTSDILNKILSLLINENQTYEPHSKEIKFITQHLTLILDNSILRSRLLSIPILLSHIILENTFLNKNVAYFKNNQTLITRLGQQLRKIEIKDKNEFIKIFTEQRKFFISDQTSNYPITSITNQLSTVSLKDEKSNLIKQNVN